MLSPNRQRPGDPLRALPLSVPWLPPGSGDLLEGTATRTAKASPVQVGGGTAVGLGRSQRHRLWRAKCREPRQDTVPSCPEGQNFVSSGPLRCAPCSFPAWVETLVRPFRP